MCSTCAHKLRTLNPVTSCDSSPSQHGSVESRCHDLRDRQVAYKSPRHRWAVVSGSIDPEDPSPQAAAWREIHEETTLTQSSLELMRQGKSYVLPDESIGREWTIYPFAFRLKEASEGGKGEDAIRLDWEHETWAWYDPFEVEDSEIFGAVPRLAESLRRVWLVVLPPLPPLPQDAHTTTHTTLFS